MTYVNIFFAFRSHLTVQTNRAVPCLIQCFVHAESPCARKSAFHPYGIENHGTAMIFTEWRLGRHSGRLMNKTEKRPVPYYPSDAPVPGW